MMEVKVRGLPVQDIKTFLAYQVYPVAAKHWQRQSLRHMAEHYKLERGRLYRCFSGMRRLVLESEEEIVSILSAYHVGQSGVHYDPCQMRDRLFTRYYWPDMTARIRKWVDGCEECVKMEGPVRLSAPVYVKRAQPKVNNNIKVADMAHVISDSEDNKPSSSSMMDKQRPTGSSGNGGSYLQCPYCYYQCHTKTSFQIHIGSHHPLRCEDMPVGRLGKVVFYQRTAKLFHCHICFFTSKDYAKLFDHLLVSHCFSGKTQQTDEAEGADKAKKGCSNGEGDRDSPELQCGEVSDQEKVLDVVEQEKLVEETKVSSVEDHVKTEEDHVKTEKGQSTEGGVVSGQNEDSNLSSGSLKRKRSFVSCSEEEEDEEDDEEDLDSSQAAKEEKDAAITEYVEQLSSRYYYCKFCKWRCKKKGFLVHHISQKHDVPKPHACKECNKTFMLETLLSSHVNSCHKQGLYQCPFCSFESNFLRGIRRHLNHCKAEEGDEGVGDVADEEKQ